MIHLRVLHHLLVPYSPLHKIMVLQWKQAHPLALNVAASCLLPNRFAASSPRLRGRVKVTARHELHHTVESTVVIAFELNEIRLSHTCIENPETVRFECVRASLPRYSQLLESRPIRWLSRSSKAVMVYPLKKLSQDTILNLIFRTMGIPGWSSAES